MDQEWRIIKIKDILEQLRPLILKDGGDIEFVKLENNTMYIRFVGACINCPSSFFTLKFGIEQAIQKELPDIVEVVPIE